MGFQGHNEMRKLLLLAILFPVSALAQSMGGTAITQGGNTAQVVSTSGGALQVSVVGGGSGGAAYADEAAYTLGTSSYNPIGCYYQTTVTTGALSSGQGGIAQCDTNRRLFVVGAGTAGSASGGVVSVQGVASMTPLEVSPTTAANTLSNQFFTQLTDGTHGVTINSTTYTSKYGLDVNILGSDGTAFGTAGIVDINNKQVSGSTMSTAATGVQLVGVEGNAGAAFDAATGAAPPANALLMGGLGSGATGGHMIAIPVADTTVSKSITTATTTLIITGVSGRQVRIGAYSIWTSGATNLEWIEGTGATCGTGTVGMEGGATSGLSMNFSAAGGVVKGTGLGTVLQTATAGDSVCLVSSAAVNVGLNAQYAIY
jgi:hypothetical protein